MSLKSLLAVVWIVVAGGSLQIVHAEDLSSYQGAELFKRFCASCHGEKGRGDGPVAPFFKLLPPDLTGIAKRHGGEFPTEQVRKIIDGREMHAPHGAREMPVWGLEFYFANPNEAQRAKEADLLVNKLVEYLRSLQE